MTSTPSSASSRAGASFASATSRAERLRRLTAGELLDAARALFLLAFVPVVLDRWGLRRLQLRARRRRRRWPRVGARSRPPVPDAELARARRIAWIVEALARRVPWKPNCLERSLVLWWLLRRRGIDAELRIGARRVGAGEAAGGGEPGGPQGERAGAGAGKGPVVFHAWVEHGDAVLNEAAHVRRLYATFRRPVAPPEARWR